MITVAGVFDSAERAQRAAVYLRQTGLTRINLLLPGASDAELDRVSTSTTEQPGMGATMGGFLGGALGAAGGLELGTAASTILIPGVGPVLAIGLAAAAVFGAAGVAGGAAAGAALEDTTTSGLPADELFVYKDALRHGKSILFVELPDDEDAERARAALGAAGAESIDAAREQHWIGLRDAEREHYESNGGDFTRDERDYRRGFELAMSEKEGEYAPIIRAASRAFRTGYERGRQRRHEG